MGKNRFVTLLCIVGVAGLLMGGTLWGQESDDDPIRQVPGSKGKLSLELKGMDVLDVLRLLSVKSGLNIVAGANVRGRVTLFLKEVDAWDAFVMILETNNLAYEINGNIIKVITDRDYELLYGDKFQNKTTTRFIQLEHARADDLAGALNQVKTRIGKVIANSRSNSLILIDILERVDRMHDMAMHMDVPTETRIFSLSYAQVDDVAPEIEKVLTENVGRVETDVRTNKIAVTDLPERIAMIAEMLREFDEKTPEVLIIAKIVEVNLSDDFGLGIDWEVFTRLLNNTLDPGTAFLDSDLSVNTISSATSGLSTLTFQRGDFNMVLKALKTFGQTNTLSSPRLLVANNEEAKILIGTDEAFVTQQTVVSAGGSNTSDEVQFVEVGTKLAVTPTVNRDGFVTIKIKPEVSSVSRTLVVGANNTTSNTTAEQTARTTVPIVSTSEAETTVVVKDAHTVVIGGLIKDTENVQTEETPFLSGLPLVGGLFRSEDREIDKTELVIFVTPYIVTGEEDIFAVGELARSVDNDERLTGPGEWSPKQVIMQKAIDEQLLLQKGLNAPNAIPQAMNDPAPYRDMLRSRILDTLSKRLPQARRAGEVELSFSVSPEGQLLGTPVILTGRNELLDPLVLQSVRDSAPFPPIPEDVGGRAQTFTIAIAFE